VPALHGLQEGEGEIRGMQVPDLTIAANRLVAHTAAIFEAGRQTGRQIRAAGYCLHQPRLSKRSGATD